ncbi:hypothetical protein MUN74_09690 [Agromyces endophyticus]|uniref:hypothetical protein n=1 Tax=Agromyces sp. H17E-10 TaxID=2932244 RepID=UPI001FD549F9|nr:hypothetical protein [Agromyces sp. H17E-10]UOQ91328.1 hypothetical protein MUN74_09690 [Agromyces sp. H17E-10]
MTTPENPQTTSPAQRPIGYWLRVVDRKLDDAMLELFAAEGITRRDWRRLNVIAGTVDDERMRAKLAARPERLAPLVDRGWVTDEPGAPRLTEEGEASYAALLERVTTLRNRVAGAVSPGDFETTLATLEAVARELGWHEGERMPRRRPESPRGRRTGRGHHHGHAPHDHHDHDRRRHGERDHAGEHGHDPHEHGHDPHEHGHDPHEHRHDRHEHGHHGHRRGHHGRDAQQVHVHVHLDGHGRGR